MHLELGKRLLYAHVTDYQGPFLSGLRVGPVRLQLDAPSPSEIRTFYKPAMKPGLSPEYVLKGKPQKNENADHHTEGRDVFLAGWRSANEQDQAPGNDRQAKEDGDVKSR